MIISPFLLEVNKTRTDGDDGDEKWNRRTMVCASAKDGIWLHGSWRDIMKLVRCRWRQRRWRPSTLWMACNSVANEESTSFHSSWCETKTHEKFIHFRLNRLHAPMISIVHFFFLVGFDVLDANKSMPKDIFIAHSHTHAADEFVRV